MRFLKRRFILYLVSVALLAFVTLGTTNTAFALSESGPTSASATPVTLNGTDQTTTYTLPLTVVNQTGSGKNNGWNLTITSTTFTTGTHSLSTTASTINAVTVTGCGSGCTAPTNGVSYPLPVPAGSTAPGPTPVKFFNAAVNTGIGNMTITPKITIAIPANTFAGTYTCTVTIVITSGP